MYGLSLTGGLPLCLVCLFIGIDAISIVSLLLCEQRFWGKRPGYANGSDAHEELRLHCSPQCLPRYDAAHLPEAHLLNHTYYRQVEALLQWDWQPTTRGSILSLKGPAFTTLSTLTDSVAHLGMTTPTQLKSMLGMCKTWSSTQHPVRWQVSLPKAFKYASPIKNYSNWPGDLTFAVHLPARVLEELRFTQKDIWLKSTRLFEQTEEFVLPMKSKLDLVVWELTSGDSKVKAFFLILVHIHSRLLTPT